MAGESTKPTPNPPNPHSSNYLHSQSTFHVQVGSAIFDTATLPTCSPTVDLSLPNRSVCGPWPTYHAHGCCRASMQGVEEYRLLAERLAMRLGPSLLPLLWRYYLGKQLHWAVGDNWEAGARWLEQAFLPAPV